MSKETRLLTRAATEGDVLLAKRIIDSRGLSDRPEWQDGYKFLRIAVKNNHTAFVEFLLFSGCSVKTETDIFSPLHFAVKNTNVEIVELLLSRGADVNNKNEEGKTPLLLAIDNGCTPIIHLLLDHGSDVNAKYENDLTPLHFACKKNLKDVAKVLVAKGADVHAKTKYDETPLHTAVLSQSSTVVNFLISKGAQVDCEDKIGRTVLRVAVVKGILSTVRAVLKCNPDVEKNRVCLESALLGNGKIYGKIIQALVKYGINVQPEDGKNSKMLNGAADKGNLAIVKDLIQFGADVNNSQPWFHDGARPLHCALKSKHGAVARFLISAKADLNAEDRYKRPPIYYAVENIDLKMTKLLLSSGANVRDFPKVLHEALQKGSFKIIEALVSNGADVNAGDEYGRSALHFAVFDKWVGRTAIEFERKPYQYLFDDEPRPTRDITKITQLLLSKGANIDAQTNAGVTILHGSIYLKSYETAEFLLAQNANVFLEDSEGATALHISAHRGHKNITTILLGKGLKVNAKLKNGNTPLHLAVVKERVDVTKLLLENGAEVNGRGKDGSAPLHLARNFEIIDILMEFGANIDAIRQDGKTALHLRSKQGDEYNVAKLLEHGADINIKSKYSNTALDDTYENDYYDDEGTYYDNSDDESDEGISETRLILVRHEIKMKALGLFVAGSRLSKKYKGKLENFKTKCQEEVARMKKEFVKGTNVSYYDVLRKGTCLARYMKNENVVLASELGEYRSEFPVYASMIKCQFRKALARSKLLTAASEGIERFIALPEVCTGKIIDYLSDEDLKVLIEV